MGLPAPVSRKLRDALGSDASELLVTWLEEMRSEHLAALARIDGRFDRLEKRFDGVDQRLTGLEIRIAETKADLMKWSFVFWCGAVAAIAALAGVLRT